MLKHDVYLYLFIYFFFFFTISYGTPSKLLWNPRVLGNLS
jgi:hypothetical protein